MTRRSKRPRRRKVNRFVLWGVLVLALVAFWFAIQPAEAPSLTPAPLGLAPADIVTTTRATVTSLPRIVSRRQFKT
jgi:hypothetical protein